MKILATIPAALLLIACGGSSTGDSNAPPINMSPTDGMLPEIQAATLSQHDYDDSLDLFGRVDDLNKASPIGLPEGVGGSATYTGVMDAQFPLPGNLDQHLVGDVELDITFNVQTLGNVTGSIDNLHIVQGGTPTESLTGSLVMGGQYNFTNNRELNVNGQGNLVGTFGTDRVGEMNFNISLTGDMRGQNADQFIGITGNVQGTANGDFGYPLFYSENSAGIQAGQFFVVRDGATVPE